MTDQIPSDGLGHVDRLGRARNVGLTIRRRHSETTPILESGRRPRMGRQKLACQDETDIISLLQKSIYPIPKVLPTIEDLRLHLQLLVGLLAESDAT